jgi:hypothetical protein
MDAVDAQPTTRIGLVLRPRRTPASAVARIAAWTATHGVELVATAEDVARADVAGVTAVPPEDLAGTCDALIALGGDGRRTRLPPATRWLAAGPCRGRQVRWSSSRL